jgi:predicted DsbA family dithiol-disulfide isomerase
MHDLLFQHQGQLDFEDFIGYAATLDLDVEQFTRALVDAHYAARVQEDVASAEASGARGTPTFFIGTRRHVGPFDTETLSQALRAMDSRSP